MIVPKYKVLDEAIERFTTGEEGTYDLARLMGINSEKLLTAMWRDGLCDSQGHVEGELTKGQVMGWILLELIRGVAAVATDQRVPQDKVPGRTFKFGGS